MLSYQQTFHITFGKGPQIKRNTEFKSLPVIIKHLHTAIAEKRQKMLT